MLLYYAIYIHNIFLVPAVEKSNQAQQSKGKENIALNSEKSVTQKLTTAKQPQLLKNLLQKWTIQPPKPANADPSKNELTKSKSTLSNKAVSKISQPIGHRQFQYAEEQKKRKDLLVKKLKEQEGKELKPNFHANPAPKVKPVIVKPKQPNDCKKLVMKNSLLSIPVLRKTLRLAPGMVPSCGNPERLKCLNEKKKMMALLLQEPQVPFKARPAAVLKELPFKPIRNVKSTETKPFSLQLTGRLLQRSEFDKKRDNTLATRKKQEEVRQRQQALDDRKLIRQKTEFRARPNPFRNNH